MGIQIKKFTQLGNLCLESLTDEVSQWAIQDHGFTLRRKEIKDEGVALLRLEKKGLMRELSGLVFTYDLEITSIEGGLLVKVDEGDWTKQALAMGVAWFLFWPMLITAGLGIFAKGEFTQQLLRQIEQAARNTEKALLPA